MAEARLVDAAAKVLRGGEPTALLLGRTALLEPGLVAAARVAAACGANGNSRELATSSAARIEPGPASSRRRETSFVNSMTAAIAALMANRPNAMTPVTRSIDARAGPAFPGAPFTSSENAIAGLPGGGST